MSVTKPNPSGLGLVLRGVDCLCRIHTVRIGDNMQKNSHYQNHEDDSKPIEGRFKDRKIEWNFHRLTPTLLLLLPCSGEKAKRREADANHEDDSYPVRRIPFNVNGCVHM